MPDSSTKFGVYILGMEKLKKCQEILDVEVPDEEIKIRLVSRRVYFASETGYLTIALYKRVMECFTNWWRSHSSTLECFLRVVCKAFTEIRRYWIPQRIMESNFAISFPDLHIDSRCLTKNLSAH